MISKFYVYRYFFIILVVVVSLPFIAYLIQFNKYVCNPFKLGQIQLIQVFFLLNIHFIILLVMISNIHNVYCRLFIIKSDDTTNPIIYLNMIPIFFSGFIAYEESEWRINRKQQSAKVLAIFLYFFLLLLFGWMLPQSPSRFLFQFSPKRFQFDCIFLMKLHRIYIYSFYASFVNSPLGVTISQTKRISTN